MKWKRGKTGRVAMVGRVITKIQMDATRAGEVMDRLKQEGRFTIGKDENDIGPDDIESVGSGVERGN